jgi:hypothetical protein
MSAFIALIQHPHRTWEKPYRHQKLVVLHADSINAMVARLRNENHLKAGAFVLEVKQVGA